MGGKGFRRAARRVRHRGGLVELDGGAVLVGGRRMLQDHVDIIDRRPRATYVFTGYPTHGRLTRLRP